MDVLARLRGLKKEKGAIVLGVLLLAIFGITSLGSDTESLNVGTQTLTPINQSGDALATTTYAGRVVLVKGGLVNDSFNIFRTYGKMGEDIRALDCSNGTGEGCILVFDK